MSRSSSTNRGPSMNRGPFVKRSNKQKGVTVLNQIEEFEDDDDEERPKADEATRVDQMTTATTETKLLVGRLQARKAKSASIFDSGRGASMSRGPSMNRGASMTQGPSTNRGPSVDTKNQGPSMSRDSWWIDQGDKKAPTTTTQQGGCSVCSQTRGPKKGFFASKDASRGGRIRNVLREKYGTCPACSESL